MADQLNALIAQMQADQTRYRNGKPREGDGVVWVVDHEEPLSPEVAELLRKHPWPFGWSVIRDAENRR